jgi:acyl-CoA thioesterase
MDARRTTAEHDPQALADASAQTMWAQDHASKGLGMTLVRVGPGEAVLSMTIRNDMVNGHGICHGGFMFTLADSTFAFACNSYGQPTVAQQCAITFIHPVRQGETLIAHAVERSRVGRGGIYDVTVRDSSNTVVAEFRGHSRTVAGPSLAATTDK